MNKHLPPRRGSLSPVGAGLLLVAGAAWLVLGAGCSKSEAATSRGPARESVPVGAGPKAESETFVAEMKASSGYKVGSEGVVEVTLSPKGSYHTNAQYPYKFKMADPAPEGVTFPKAVLQRADGSFEEKRGSFKVPFVAAKPGKYTIAGTFHLSVCSDANCIMDKVALEVPVDVK
jgi:hypothetical protein